MSAAAAFGGVGSRIKHAGLLLHFDHIMHVMNIIKIAKRVKCNISHCLFKAL